MNWLYCEEWACQLKPHYSAPAFGVLQAAVTEAKRSHGTILHITGHEDFLETQQAQGLRTLQPYNRCRETLRA
jgi:hypothetical protein